MKNGLRKSMNKKELKNCESSTNLFSIFIEFSFQNFSKIHQFSTQFLKIPRNKTIFEKKIRERRRIFPSICDKKFKRKFRSPTRDCRKG